MADPNPALRCDKCGGHPTTDEAKYTAKLGGTHWRFLQHGAGIPGHRGGRQARKCGTWVAVEGSSDAA
jgi:hypothetical protein